MCHNVKTLDLQQFLLRVAALIRCFLWGNIPEKQCMICGQTCEHEFAHHGVKFYACTEEGGSRVGKILPEFYVGGGYWNTRFTGVFAWHPDMGQTLPKIGVDLNGNSVMPFDQAMSHLPVNARDELFDSMESLAGVPPSGNDQDALRAVIFGKPTKSLMADAVSGWGGAVDAVREWVTTLVAPQA